MKVLFAAVISVLTGLTLLPVLLASGDGPPPMTVCSEQAGSIDVILRTIRSLESGGDYQAQAPGASASGAYQFVDASWNHYDGYVHAKDAPPNIQDAKATEHVTGILDANHGDVTTIPVVWYIGHLPPAGSVEWDTVPMPSAGNRLTPRQYQTKWMTVYQRLLGDVASTEQAATSTSTPDPSGSSTTSVGSVC